MSSISFARIVLEETTLYNMRFFNIFFIAIDAEHI